MWPSPLVAAVYMKCALLGIELGDLQRFAWKYALCLCFVLIGAALLFRSQRPSVRFSC